ncbi:MAG: hypothetical protein KA055_01915 [Aliarcobacter sp.]|nr:hypothetical protein [Aliarcobacter sp.]
MKDLKQFIIKLIISAIVLALAFIYLDKREPTTAIHFDINKQDAPSTPSKLRWNDPFKGIENMPSK